VAGEMSMSSAQMTMALMVRRYSGSVQEYLSHAGNGYAVYSLSLLPP
jgi:hypothetical protein